MPRALLLQVGHTFPEIASVRGDYDRWFQHGLGYRADELEVARVFEGAPVPSRFDYDGVVVTGSWSMVTNREPWSEASADYLREAVARELPVLGVCYGHQLLAHAVGGLVGYNPTGRHAGTALVELTPAAQQDALFSPFEGPMVVQVSHSQAVLDLPAGAVLLGRCERDPHHAFRLGQCAWGVQFHPEFDADIARQYIQMRYTTMAAEGINPEALLAKIQDSSHGHELLQRFRSLID